jgi:predicted nucleic acid-binding protein
MPSDVLFLDSAYAIALAAPGDETHSRAAGLAAELRSRNQQMLTTEAVVFEIGDALAKPRFRRTAIELMTSIFTDPRIEVVHITPALVQRAFDLFERRPDKAWGMTDCLSFIVMEDRGIRQALTTDEHFEQAGFVALLKQQN